MSINSINKSVVQKSWARSIGGRRQSEALARDSVGADVGAASVPRVTITPPSSQVYLERNVEKTHADYTPTLFPEKYWRAAKSSEVSSFKEIDAK